MSPEVHQNTLKVYIKKVTVKDGPFHEVDCTQKCTNNSKWTSKFFKVAVSNFSPVSFWFKNIQHYHSNK